MIDTTIVDDVIAAIKNEVEGSVHEGGTYVGFFEEEGNRSGEISKAILSARRKLSLSKKKALRLINDLDYNQGLTRDHKFGELPVSYNPTKKGRALKNIRISNIISDRINNTKTSGTEKKTNPQIAFWNHYGTTSSQNEGAGSRKTPPRPFLDVAIDKRTNELSKFIEEILKKDYNTNDLLHLVGERATYYIQKEIIDLKSPPLSQATISKKLSQDPLIDTGEMLRSVTHKKME